MLSMDQVGPWQVHGTHCNTFDMKLKLVPFVDSLASAAREISFFFPEFDFEQWMELEEQKFRLGSVYWDKDLGIHTVETTS